ncbi:EpsG family protein [uncultured Catenibacterium sp.]|uniref:EpsG family protein n=1 Tax=uncultured Catenibacterium sp. TaxID=286142 RepID=UPI0025F5A947|nr:EpsG family protein [uncultured Catenibacterium sp.]
MVLTNYWMLLIWILTVGLFLNVVIPKTLVTIEGKSEYRWGKFSAFLLVVPYIVWAGFRTDWFGDTPVYRMSFYDAASSLSALPAYAASQTKDTGFYVLNSLFKIFISSSSVVFFLAIAAFQMFCIMRTYRKYSSDYWMSIFLFIVSTDYLSYMHNGMRQFIAVCGIFACFGFILKKEYLKTIIVILLLSTIHQTCLIMIPIIFIVQGKAFNKRTFIFIILTILVLVSLNQFTSFLENALKETQYNDTLLTSVWKDDDGTSIFRVIVYSVPMILSIFGKKYIDQANNPMINICVNCSIVTSLLYIVSKFTSGIFIGRLPIYTSLTGYILLPWLIDHIFEKKSAGIIKIIMMLLYVLFFYYQMHFSWKLL